MPTSNHMFLCCDLLQTEWYDHDIPLWLYGPVIWMCGPLIWAFGHHLLNIMWHKLGLVCVLICCFEYCFWPE